MSFGDGSDKSQHDVAGPVEDRGHVGFGLRIVVVGLVGFGLGGARGAGLRRRIEVDLHFGFGFGRRLGLGLGYRWFWVDGRGFLGFCGGHFRRSGCPPHASHREDGDRDVDGRQERELLAVGDRCGLPGQDLSRRAFEGRLASGLGRTRCGGGSAGSGRGAGFGVSGRVCDGTEVIDDFIRTEIPEFRDGVRRATDDFIEPMIAFDDGGSRTRIRRGKVAGEQFMKQNPNRVNVRAMTDGLGGSDDFGRGIIRGSENIRAFRDSRANRTGQPEIADFRLGILVEQDVRRLDIAVDDAEFVGMGKAAANPGDEADDFGNLNGTAVGRVIERFARHILHDDIEHAVDVAEVEDADQIGMVEAGHGLGLGLETCVKGGVLAEFLGQDLDGDRAFERFLDGAIDGTHAAGGDQAIEGVRWEERCEFGNLRGDEGDLRRVGITHGGNREILWDER